MLHNLGYYVRPFLLIYGGRYHKNYAGTFFFFAHQFSLVFLYWMCGPRQLFFFHCGSYTPKSWTPPWLRASEDILWKATPCSPGFPANEWGFPLTCPSSNHLACGVEGPRQLPRFNLVPLHPHSTSQLNLSLLLRSNQLLLYSLSVFDFVD